MHTWEVESVDLQRQVDEVFEEVVYRRWAIGSRGRWRPAADLHETADAFLVEVDLPGVEPESVRLLANERELMVAGQRQVEVPAGVVFQQCERPAGVFHRSITFPRRIDPRQARAEYRHGVCRVHVPKALPVEPSQRPSDLNGGQCVIEVMFQ